MKRKRMNKFDKFEEILKAYVDVDKLKDRYYALQTRIETLENQMDNHRQLHNADNHRQLHNAIEARLIELRNQLEEVER